MTDDIRGSEDQHLAMFFQKYPVVAARGSGAILWDADNKSYVDCMGGYGAALVGHCHPEVVRAIREQSERLITCHPSIYNEARARALDALQRIAPNGMQRIFLSNSGAEAVECAIKLALSFTRRKELVSMVGGFHGRTLGTLSVTWNKKYRAPFEQALYPHVKFARYGDALDIRKLVTQDTAAVLVEPIQGESGIRIPPDGFLSELREISKKAGAVMIADEIQSGLGRTGKMWACDHWHVDPDITCLAKGIAGGVPMGATFATEEIMGSLKVGEHGTTFGGNPLACAAAAATVNVILRDGLVDRAAEMGSYFLGELARVKDSHRMVREVRGKGLMLAAEMRSDIHSLLMGLIARGVIPLYSGRTVLRLLPPLVIEKDQVRRVLDSLDDALSEEEKRGLAEAGRKVPDEIS